LLLVGLNGFGQKSFLLDTNQVIFKLKIEAVKEVNSDRILTNVIIKIIGTDSTKRKFISDSLGTFPTINLKPNTSYTTIVSKPGYYICKGKETTVGYVKSKLIIHEYTLQPICKPFKPIMPNITYEDNTIQPKISEDEIVKFYNIMVENPILAVRITGYRKEYEKSNLPNRRTQYFAKRITKLGSNKKRLDLSEGGVPKNDNYLMFKIIRADFQEKN
jgi:hypothetical protein